MLEKSTYYILDAQGNTLSTYDHVVDTDTSVVNYYLKERQIYGSSRLGMNTVQIDMADTDSVAGIGDWGYRYYELSNHLGNVLTVINDEITPLSSGGSIVDGYRVGIVRTTDYSPFGVELDGRGYNPSAVCTDSIEVTDSSRVYLINNEFTSGTDGWSLFLGTASASGDSLLLVHTPTSTSYSRSPGSFGTDGVTVYYEMDIDYGNCGGNLDSMLLNITIAGGSTNRTITSSGLYTGSFVTNCPMFCFSGLGLTLHGSTGCTAYMKSFKLYYYQEDTTYMVCNGGGSSLANNGDYRYGFQGQESDDEVKGEGNSVNYKYRMHDPRIGRFFAVDPLTKEYPHYTPYSFSGNEVIAKIELEGLEPSDVKLGEAKKGETYQGSNKQNGANPNLIYNWKLNVSSFEQSDGTKTETRSWEMGSQYTGPTKDEAANLANAVYNVSNGTAQNGKEAPNTQYKLISGVNALGFSAGLYERDIDGVKFNAMAFAGTDDGYDAATDVSQAFNLPDYQFAFAARFGDLAKGKKNFTFIGHSLGGGLAALASSRSNQPAITFNAAGLSTGTKLQYKAFNFKKVDAYIIRGEILNTTLIPLGQGANGTRHFQNGNGSKISKHGINNFL